MSSKTMKSYFYTSSLETKLPHEFVYSENPKYIIVIHCRAIYADSMVGDIKMHASFIERNRYDNGFCIFTNTILTKYKKYEIKRRDPSFTLNFTDMNGQSIDPQSFTLELLLVY